MLTGGIATGKSYVLTLFAALGVPTIDADAIARDVVHASQPAASEIRAHFGDDAFQADGEVDRPRLARRVFDNHAERMVLESIVHPRVRAAIDNWFSTIAADGTVAFAVADIPLVFETGHASAFDRVVVTACARDRQLERLLVRNTANADEAQKRMDAQLPTTEKIKQADYVVWTDRSFAETDTQVKAVHAALQALADRSQTSA